MDQHQQPQGMLSGIFGGTPMSPGEMFTHEREEDILASAIAVLKLSETGRHLLGVLKERDVGVRIIKNRNAHGYAPSPSIIYLGVPPQLSEADAYTIIEFAAAIREIEQDLMGFTMPEKPDDPLEAAQVRHAKTLDIVAYMCKVSLELEVEIGNASYVGAMERLGLGEALRMYLTQMGDEAAIEAYENAQKVQ
ncbi:MAG: hypothetical protein EOM26_05945 [Alphaproteobacteria bacterium]|nr:hypothetical protein [Alphaproteobacteria bacterium]